MKPRVLAILVAVVIPLTVLAVVVATRGGSRHEPARLPIAVGSGGGAGTTIAGADAARPALYPYGGIVYNAAPGLPALTGSAPAYKVAGGAEVTKLVEALGLPATPDANGTYTDGDAQLSVSPSGAWGYSRNPSGVVSSGTAVACPANADCPPPKRIPRGT